MAYFVPLFVRIADNACMRAASAGVFAAPASFSRPAPRVCSSAASFLLEGDAWAFATGSVQRRDLFRSHRAAAVQLVDIGASHDEIRRPSDLRLVLNVQLVEMHLVRGIDFILRKELARRKLEDVDAARDLRAINVAVVPIDRPHSARRPRRFV